MSRPVVLVVDPSSDLTCQMADDLRANFRGIHVLTANSAARGEEIMNRLKQDKRRLALLICDRTTCSGLPEACEKLFPDAYWAWLAPAAGERTIVKPWQPPEEHLAPTVSKLLDAWTESQG
jgi:thioredoxin reductase (NADPH)